MAWLSAGILAAPIYSWSQKMAGFSWTDLTPVENVDQNGDPVLDFIAEFYGADHVWLMANSVDITVPDSAVVMYSSDGGATFQISQPLDLSGLIESFFVGQIQFIDANQGWLLAHVGAGMNHDYISIYQNQRWRRNLATDSRSDLIG